MKVPEKYRITNGPMRSDESFGNNGAFKIPLSNRTIALVIASEGKGWEQKKI